jgi:hypothetical protein
MEQRANTVRTNASMRVDQWSRPGKKKVYESSEEV